jgi:phosphoribosylglycinamide formyltransferase 2
MLLGSGELGKEVAIELQRLGVEVVAVDRYEGAPAMAVAHRSHVIDMLDADVLSALLDRERPHVVIPEIEAIATDVLVAYETSGAGAVRPSAGAVVLTMDREGIRRLAAETLGLPTSPYRFAQSLAELEAAIAEVGRPCVVKPVQSSSGKGQTVIPASDDAHVAAWAASAWENAQGGARGARGSEGEPIRMVVEAFVAFDYEITMLACRSASGTVLCEPIGHTQIDGDYRESWQPAAMSPLALGRSREIASRVVEALGGYGVFGVELFVSGDDVLFNEVSPRPHDTGLVTLAGQDVSEFAMHARAVLGLPVAAPSQVAPAASCAIVAEGSGVPRFAGVDAALAIPTADLRLFGKPRVDGSRRVAVTLARGVDVDEARSRAREAASALVVHLD